MKKMVPSVLSCKTTFSTFLCKTIWWEQLRACIKLQVCQMQLNSLMGFENEYSKTRHFKENFTLQNTFNKLP
jgi:hypothetical protein